MWSHRTKTGRVVYDRKPNRFRCTDWLRIGRAVGSAAAAEPFFDQKVADLACLAEVAANQLRDVAYTLDRIGAPIEIVTLRLQRVQELIDTDFEGFSGGTFGGAGATR